MRIILNLALLGVSVGGFLVAANGSGPFSAPEIDPASAVSALALVVATLAVVLGRRKKSVPLS